MNLTQGLIAKYVSILMGKSKIARLVQNILELKEKVQKLLNIHMAIKNTLMVLCFLKAGFQSNLAVCA